MTFAFIEQHRDTWLVTLMRQTLGVTPQGFYARRCRPTSPRQQRRDALAAQIRAVHAKVQQRYGSPRHDAELKAQGVDCCVNTVAQVMRAHGLRAKTARRFRHTTDSNHPLPVADNLLERQFHAQAPNQRWVADISYIPTWEGWLYLAVVEDLYARMVVGWSMGNTLTSRLVVDALELAVARRLPGEGCWRPRIGGASTPASTTNACWSNTPSRAA